MRRLRTAPMLLLALVAVVALAASACSSSSISGDAIVVNGVGLSNADFQKRLDLIKADATYAKKAVTDTQGQAIDLTGDAAGTYNTDFTTGVLNQQVSFVLAEQEVANRGLEVTDTDIQNAETALANDLTTTTATDTSGSVTDDGSGAQSLTDLGPFKDTLVRGIANILALRADFAAKLSTDEALQKAFDESGDTYKNQACASVILLLAGQGPSQDPTTGATVPPADSDFAAALTKANGLSDQLAAGADFATLAKTSSDDSQTGANGGDLGCNPIGSYAQQQPEIDAAITNQALGKAGQPVKTNFGYAIVLVRSRGDLTFDEAKAQLKTQVPTLAKSAFQQWFIDAAKAATVTVDPQYGSWDASTGTVVAPEGATTSTTAPGDSSSTTIDPLAALNGGTDSSTTSSP
ncbi:MAG: peptidylprolyl isomerase [Acidimicrobiales bacterium]